MPTHMNLRWTEMEEAMKGARKLQNLAEQYGISDIFADNGGKVLQIAVAIGLDIVPGRVGPDAADRMGNEYELKTTDLNKKITGYSTSHHLTCQTIERYTERRFVFAEYEGIDLMAAYLLTPDDMTPVYRKWRSMIRGRTHLNNPKINVDYVRENGQIMYMKDVAPPWVVNPSDGSMRSGRASEKRANTTARPGVAA